MKQILKVGEPSSAASHSPILPQTAQAMLHLWAGSHGGENLASELSKVFEIGEFQLGAEFLNYTIGETGAEPTAGGCCSDFYFVCQGRVRLLVTDAQRGYKESTALVLEAGDGFGADDRFCNAPLPYRAIAANSGAIARISSANLQRFLEQVPALREHLQQETDLRQQQIFFKTCTELRSLPSHQLQQLLPYIAEQHIPRGSRISEITPTSSGRCWLKSGEIDTGRSGSAVSALGTSWGYPQPVPADWVAASDVVAYQLPAGRWQEALAIAPDISAAVGERPSNGHHPSSAVKKGQHSERRSDRSTPAPPPTSSPQPSKPEAEAIAFPKPASRRLLDLLAKYPFINQQSSSDCGATCLVMISQYWGKRFSLNYLRELCAVGRSGASLQGLAKAAESLGFLARPVRASLSKIAEQKNPWIAHWQGIHYVVVYRARGDRLLIADPAIGMRYVPRQEFLQSWTGYALLLDPTDRLKQAETQKISLSQFLAALSPHRATIGQIIFASFLIQIFGLITPLFTQIILDQVVVNKSLTALNVFIVGLLLFGIWSTGLTATRQYLLSYFSNRLNLTLIGGFINHTLMLPLKFFESRRVGDIITRVQENQKIQRFLIGQVVLAWLDMLMGMVYLGLMLYYNLHLTLLVLAMIPPIVILTLVGTPLLRRVSREIFNEAAEQNSLLVEMLSGMSTVKAVAAEREIRWRWEDKFTSTLNAGFRGQKLGIVLQTMGSSINTLGSTALLWYGASLVITEQLSIGQFVAFNMMIGRVIAPFLALVGIWNQMQEVLISVERLNDVFEAQPEESPGKAMLILPRLQGEVLFDNVTFRYSQEQDRNTLQNISFQARPGQTIAIVGRSGSGKSTLVSLLQGFYHPDSGRICIDGHDIRHVSPQSLRSQLGVVPQECFLFSGTIWENITLYRPEFTLEQVAEVAKLAEAQAFIQDLPLGYNTKVGERGASLSGGQRQRVAIARALLGDPRILVLDEATSSLDTESERRFQQNLERLARDRTTFIIAHRLSTVRNADSILVLDRGILVEQGTHDELMAHQGLYYHLAQQQLSL